MRVIFIVLAVVPLVLAYEYNDSSPIEFTRRTNRRVDELRGLTPAVMTCGQHESRNSYPDSTCNTKKVENSDCDDDNPLGCQLYSATARKAYVHCCPEMECAFITIPCPRKSWDKDVIPDFLVTCKVPNVAYIWHYEKKKLDVDTLYDMQSNHMVDADKRATKEYTDIRERFHTCVQAIPVTHLIAVAHGLGWMYLKWRRPPENCYTKIMYKEEYTIKKETFNQSDVGDYRDRATLLFFFKKFHPCPEYPAWFCFIISENVAPFTEFEFQVAYDRFKGEPGVDTADYKKIKLRTDDKSTLIPFCPTQNFFLTIWFLILLIILLVLLLIVAAVLVGLLMSRKKKEQRRQDMEDAGYEEEHIPPSNILEKLWERLKNFFDTLCPRPKKPPPPPPPPPKPPKPPKKKSKLKLKPKPKPKPKTPTPSPSPSPEPPPPRRPPPRPPPKKPKAKKVEAPKPPPPPPPPHRKAPRGPRAEKRGGRVAAAIDTKRAQSAVGGGGRPRRRLR